MLQDETVPVPVNAGVVRFPFLSLGSHACGAGVGMVLCMNGYYVVFVCCRLPALCWTELELFKFCFAQCCAELG